MMRLAQLCTAITVFGLASRHVSGQVDVGPTVHVSTALPTTTHDEVSLGTDPTDPQRLVACSIVDTPLFSGQHGNRTVVYTSFDGGRTWALGTRSTLEASDPSCVYGPDGAAYFASIGSDKDIGGALELRRSTDGGHTWGLPLLSKGGDRPWLAMDPAHGGKAGALYVVDQERLDALQPDSLHGLMGLYLRRSIDGGETWSALAIRLQMGGSVKPGSEASPSRAVVLSDGTVMVLYEGFERSSTVMPVRAGMESRGFAYYVTSSTDSGRTLSEGVKIARYVQFYGGSAATPGGLATLAADVGRRSSFPNRLYAAWADVRSGRSEIYFSYSTDKGRTWTPPRVVSDDSAWPAPKTGPDNELPTLAVNANGAVGLMWYDRRDNSDNLGFYPRFRASLDGGDTWSPSVRLTDQPDRFVQPDGTQLATEVTQPGDVGELAEPDEDSGARARRVGPLSVHVRNFEWIANGHTAGLEADARGVFHPLWVDNRTGVKQVYTTAVTVSGPVVRNGAGTLAGLVDLTPAVTVNLTPAAYDSVTHVVTLRARLHNTSRDTLRGPFVMRALQVTSELGSPRVLNADNNKAIEGATWQFGSSVGSMLPPGATTGERELKFQLIPQVAPQRGNGRVVLKSELITIDARVLGGPASGRAP